MGNLEGSHSTYVAFILYSEEPGIASTGLSALFMTISLIKVPLVYSVLQASSSL